MGTSELTSLASTTLLSKATESKLQELHSNKKQELRAKLHALKAQSKSEEARLEALRDVSSEYRSKLQSEQSVLNAADAKLEREEAKVQAIVSADQHAIAVQIEPAQHAVFKRTDSYLAYKRHAERDADMEKMLKAAVLQERRDAASDAARAGVKARLAIVDNALSHNETAKAAAAAAVANADAAVAGKLAAEMREKLATVRRQSALAFDQQIEAQHLRKAGHPKVAHLVEKIAFSKTERVNAELAELAAENVTYKAEAAVMRGNETLASTARDVALELAELSHITAGEALALDRETSVLDAEARNAAALLPTLVADAKLEGKLGHSEKALVDADVATWMGRQLRLKDVREREEQLSSPLQAEKARYMQLKATNQKDVEMASHIQSLAAQLKQKLASAQSATELTAERLASTSGAHRSELMHSPVADAPLARRGSVASPPSYVKAVQESTAQAAIQASLHAEAVLAPSPDSDSALLKRLYANRR